MNAAPSAPTRLVYLDWLRVAAFGLLILYHIGMFYVTWGWHVKSSHAGHAIEPLMLLTNPWRLTLLFLVSGAATRFMADKLSAGALAGRRTIRLLVPLLFAMAVIVPPQLYYEVVEKLGYADGYLAFWGRYLAADQSFCMPDGCLDIPSWGHLWFVAYLLVYTLLLAALLAWARGPFLRLGDWLAQRLAGWTLLAWPIVFLAAARLVLYPSFEVTHALIDDWYNHAVSFFAFLFGFLLLKDGRVAAQCVRLRWVALALVPRRLRGLCELCLGLARGRRLAAGAAALGNADRLRGRSMERRSRRLGLRRALSQSRQQAAAHPDDRRLSLLHRPPDDHHRRRPPSRRARACRLWPRRRS